MSAALTRRALLRATAAVGAVGLPIAAAAETAILSSDLDADLYTLLDRFDVARAAWDATEAPLDAAMARAAAAYPSRPGALRSTFQDIATGVSGVRSDTGRERGPDGRTRGFYTADDVEALRAAGPVTTADDWDDDGHPLPAVINPHGETRRREIVTASDAWEVECESVRDAVGFTVAAAAEDAAVAAWDEAEDAVRHYQPRTLAGLSRKALWVVGRLPAGNYDDDLGQAFARQVAAFGEVAP